MKAVLLSILIILLSASAVSQTTTIPDPNFEQALINLGFDISLDGQVLTANINNVTFLDVFNTNISDLTGIEDFDELDTLYCAQNPLTTLNVTQNTVLTTLNCSYTGLTSLDVTQNTSLISLYCVNNQLTNLDVTQNTVLKNFSCYFNQLSSIDITQNSSLISFDCHNNILNAIDVTHNIALESLMCYQNQISTLDVSQNSGLLHLWCYNNLLTTLDVTQNIYLDGLYCYLNQLTNLDTSQNGILTKLICSSNQITELDLTQNIYLYYLACDDNQLTCLNVQNGNDTNNIYFNTANNPNLNCIQVDNPTYSASNWSNIDSWTSFSTDCSSFCILGVHDSNLSNLSIYPNPTYGCITIDLGEVKQAIRTTLTNSLGQVISTQQFQFSNLITLNIDTPPGVYFLRIQLSDSETKSIKVLKQ